MLGDADTAHIKRTSSYDSNPMAKLTDSIFAAHNYSISRGAQLTTWRGGVTAILYSKELEMQFGELATTKKIPRLCCGSAWLPCNLSMQRGG